jgi:hypothetical protein
VDRAARKVRRHRPAGASAAEVVVRQVVVRQVVVRQVAARQVAARQVAVQGEAVGLAARCSCS